MWGKSQESILVADPDVRAPLQPPAEALASWPPGDTVTCISAPKRLLRVLLADDNRDAADTLAMLVQLWGHEARVAYAGAAALEMSAAYQPDVLLLDIAMPGMDGCCLARQLRRQTRFQDTLLIAITGYADEAHRALCQEAGFDYRLVKPAEPSTVENLLLLELGRLARSPDAPPQRQRSRTYGSPMMRTGYAAG